MPQASWCVWWSKRDNYKRKDEWSVVNWISYFQNGDSQKNFKSGYNWNGFRSFFIRKMTKNDYLQLAFRLENSNVDITYFIANLIAQKCFCMLWPLNVILLGQLKFCIYLLFYHIINKLSHLHHFHQMIAYVRWTILGVWIIRCCQYLLWTGFFNSELNWTELEFHSE